MKKMLLAIFLSAVILLGTCFALRSVGEKRAQESHLWLLNTLMPDAGKFVLEPYTGEDGTIRSVHKGENGFVIETVTQGYVDEITMFIAVDLDGKVVGLVVDEAHETLGLGSKALTDHRFLAQFFNHSGSFAVATAGEDAFSGATGTSETAGDTLDVDAITGATVTSKAVVRCINSAIAYVTGADAASSATTWGG